MFARMFVALQYVLPRHWLTAIVYRIARIRIRALKNALIRGFVRLYNVNVDEVSLNVPADFRDFNEFFTRELKGDARPVDRNTASIVSPVDGTVSIASELAQPASRHNTRCIEP